MTLPFENDTRIIVKKLAKRNLKADKKSKHPHYHYDCLSYLLDNDNDLVFFLLLSENH